MKRAQLFAERFFQDGLIFNGHVKPQSDPWVSVIGDGWGILLSAVLGVSMGDFHENDGKCGGFIGTSVLLIGNLREKWRVEREHTR